MADDRTAVPPAIGDSGRDAWRDATIVEGRLDPRAIVVQRISSSWLATLAATGVFVTTMRWEGRYLAAYGALLVLMSWWAWAWPALSWRYTSFRVDASGLEIRRGVLFRQVVTVPRSRVQHTDVSQGPLERRYQLGTLAVHTAGTVYARVQLSGLSYRVALDLRDRLLPTGSGDAL